MTETPLTELTLPDMVWPPTQDELPYDDGVPMETHRHKLQMDLLTNPLWLWLTSYQQDFF